MSETALIRSASDSVCASPSPEECAPPEEPTCEGGSGVEAELTGGEAASVSEVPEDEGPPPSSDPKADAQRLDREVIQPQGAPPAERPAPVVDAPRAAGAPHDFVRVATLNVGDRFAKTYNSDITYQASKGNIHPQASYRLPSAEPAMVVNEPLVTTRSWRFAAPSAYARFSEASPLVLSPHRRAGEFDNAPLSGGGYRFQGPDEVPLMTAPRTVSSEVPASARPRYIKLVAYDVHATRGADPSRVLILDANGNVVRTVMLPRGQSERVIALAAGEYTIVARAGKTGPRGRKGTADEYDNFRLDIFEADVAGNSGEGDPPMTAAVPPAERMAAESTA